MVVPTLLKAFAVKDMPTVVNIIISPFAGRDPLGDKFGHPGDLKRSPDARQFASLRPQSLVL